MTTPLLHPPRQGGSRVEGSRSTDDEGERRAGIHIFNMYSEYERRDPHSAVHCAVARESRLTGRNDPDPVTSRLA